MRGGGASCDMSSTYLQGGQPKPLGGYQPSVIMEPQSATSAWQHPSVTPKSEPMEEDRNDSGITSGSDFHSSSPGSENSQERYNFQQNASTPSPYYAAPVAPNTYPQNNYGMQQGFNPLTPPNSEPMVSPNLKSDSENQDHDNTLTPCSSPGGNNTPRAKEQQEDYPLRRLQIAFANNSLYDQQTSPKPSENSLDGENKSDDDGLESWRVPKRNSHGKVKKHECKPCGVVFFTKEEYWKHKETHIKPDKVLTCRMCPFVTEYKHHLEFHLLNHSGSKPFKCDKCSYRCTNKSMLNSHMKSHSNVYQFSCANCHYATKYQHSLKLHLRRYGHESGQVLNADGTPNPLAVIDVYGTRRGPKNGARIALQKPKEEPRENPQQNFLPTALAQLMMNPQFSIPFLGGFPAGIPNPLLFPQFAAGGNAVAPQEVAPSTHTQPSNEEVLDLSKPEGGGKIVGRHRRKGKAVRLRTATLTQSPSREEDEATRSSVEESSAEEPKRSGEVEIANNNNNGPGNFTCQYCDIAFGDAVLHTIHMGCHSCKDPFTCNMCGEACKDKVSFFLHITRTPHS